MTPLHLTACRTPNRGLARHRGLLSARGALPGHRSAGDVNGRQAPSRANGFERMSVAGNDSIRWRRIAGRFPLLPPLLFLFVAIRVLICFLVVFWRGVDERPSPLSEERTKHAMKLNQPGAVRIRIPAGVVGERGRLAEWEAARGYSRRLLSG